MQLSSRADEHDICFADEQHGTILRVLPGQQKVSKKCPLLTTKHFQIQLTKKVREI
jgi:hypothetical protein